MKINLYLKKKLTSSWFAQLQEVIRYEFEKMESDFGKKTRQKPKRFEKNFWKKSNKKNEGGGTYYIMKNGLLIGCHQGLSKENIIFIHKKISQFLKKVS